MGLASYGHCVRALKGAPKNWRCGDAMDVVSWMRPCEEKAGIIVSSYWWITTSMDRSMEHYPRSKKPEILAPVIIKRRHRGISKKEYYSWPII
jgi:hypothetical protein